jgi:hypothetical protein
MDDTTNPDVTNTDYQAAEPGRENDTYPKSVTALIYSCVLIPVTFLTGQFLFIFLVALSIWSFILGVTGVLRFSKNSSKCAMMIFIACLSLWISIGTVGNRIFYDWPFSGYDDDVAEAIISNVKKADNKQQAIKSWCDIIRNNEDLQRMFGFESDETPAVDFVLNKGAAELIAVGEEVPDDMVLLFRGIEGWNQIGGREKLADSYKYNVLPLLMGNLETKHIPLKKIDNLRWHISDKAKSMANTSIIPVYSLNGIIIAALLFVVVKRRNYLLRYSVPAIIVAVVAAVGGYYFSKLGAEALYIGEPSELTDYTAVYIISAAIGIAFVLLLAPWAQKQIDNRSLFFKITFLAGLCGFSASTITHIYIMIYKDTSNLWGVIGGAGYGIYTGLVLGVIAYWIIRLFKDRKRETSTC